MHVIGCGVGIADLDRVPPPIPFVGNAVGEVYRSYPSLGFSKLCKHVHESSEYQFGAILEPLVTRMGKC